LREKKIELDRGVPQTIGVTWPKPDGVETRKDPRKNKNRNLKFGREPERQKVFHAVGVLYRRCSLQKVFSAEGVPCRRCSLQKVFSAEGVPCRRCSLQKVFSAEGVLCRRCSLPKVFSAEGVPCRRCSPHTFYCFFLFNCGVGSGPVLPGFGPVGFRPRPRSISSDGIYRKFRNTNRISAFGNRFHFTTHISILLLFLLLIISITYYIYISRFDLI
jgi:hypothetical protein